MADGGGAGAEEASSLGTSGRFPRSARILTKKEFDRIHRHGIRLHREEMTLIACPRKLEGARFGCSVSRKVGNAVIRNRLKRQMREVFRRSRCGLPDVDFVVILKPSAAHLAKKSTNDMAATLLPAMFEVAERALSPRPRRSRLRKQK